VNATAVTALAAALLGGASCAAVITYVATRKCTQAETRKYNAETERIQLETQLLRETKLPKPPPVSANSAPDGWFLFAPDNNSDDYPVGTDTTVAFDDWPRGSGGMGVTAGLLARTGWRP
jgi:hypothetical protein